MIKKNWYIPLLIEGFIRLGDISHQIAIKVWKQVNLQYKKNLMNLSGNYSYRLGMVSFGKLKMLETKNKELIDYHLTRQAPLGIYSTRETSWRTRFVNLHESYEINKIVILTHFINSETSTLRQT
jgi:hypothetical protein